VPDPSNNPSSTPPPPPQAAARDLAAHAAAITNTGSTALRIITPALACLLVGLAITAMGTALGSYPQTVLKQVGVAVVAAVSLNIVNGFTGQFSMGHAGFMAVGGYVAAGITYYASLLYFGTPQEQSGLFTMGHLFMAAGILAGACAAAGLGYMVGLPSLRLRGDYLAIVTLGFGEIVRVILQQTTPQVNASDPAAMQALRDAPLATLARLPFNGPLGFESIPSYATNLWIWAIAAATCVVAYRVKTSSSGRAFLAIREDEIAARAMGINLTKYKVRAFVLASFFAGIAGALIAHAGVPFSPVEAGFQRSFEIIILVVLGGLGSISGAVLAAIILTILPEALRDLAGYRLILYAALLITVMLVRPQGLFGVREVWDLWKKPSASKPAPAARSAT
jgi:branched-chain amino acid transport system permease protein